MRTGLYVFMRDSISYSISYINSKVKCDLFIFYAKREIKRSLLEICVCVCVYVHMYWCINVISPEKVHRNMITSVILLNEFIKGLGCVFLRGVARPYCGDDITLNYWLTFFNLLMFNKLTPINCQETSVDPDLHSSFLWLHTFLISSMWLLIVVIYYYYYYML